MLLAGRLIGRDRVLELAALAAIVGLSAGAARAASASPAQTLVCNPPRCIVTTAAGLKAALEEDLPASETRIVEVPEGTDIDVGTIELPIRIKAGHTLQGTRGALRSGAYLHLDRFFPSDYSGPRVALDVVGDDVTIRDLRLRGPSGGTDDSRSSVTAIRVGAQYSARISGNEIWDWPGIAVWVRGPGEVKTCPQNPPPPSYRVRVTGNYIHHNQRNSLGYGVAPHDSAAVLVEGNTFDWNRHAISSDGSAGVGYRAIYNYVLQGGSTYDGFLGVDYYNQHFDMHGTAGGDGGIAGDLVQIFGNTVHGEQRYGGVLGVARRTRPVYQLRGYPCRPSQFRLNVLVHEKGETLRLHYTAIGRVDSSDNHYDTDTSWSVAVGDFDRDGRDDLFQATGAAWYYSSGGQAEWRFLKGRYETIERLRFGDFDGDGATDVFRAIGGVWRISRGGTDRWRDINRSPVPLERLRFADFDGDGRTDVFWATGSRWYYSPGGSGTAQPLAASRFGVEDVLFGNFDDDSRADVFGVVSGKWAVSYDGLSTWQPLAPFGNEVDSLVLADFDGNGQTDIGRTQFDGSTVRWLVSVNGRGGWRVWREFKRTTLEEEHEKLEKHWLGRFDSSNGIDAVRYQPPASVLAPEGPYLVRSSRARGDYARLSRHGMR